MNEKSTNKQAVEAGRKLARHVFKKRGNRSEVHLKEVELAALLVVAFELGQKSKGGVG